MASKPGDFLRMADEMGAADVCAIHGGELRRLYAQALDGRLRVIWLQGAHDSGCSRSLAQGVHPDLAEAIVDFRFAAGFQPTLMIPSSDRALGSLSHALAGRAPLDLLIVEGAAPSESFCCIGQVSGRLVPFEIWVRDLAAVAKQVVAVGTCAGRSISSLVGGTPLLRIPGCPAPADRILLTLATVLSGTVRDPYDRSFASPGLPMQAAAPRWPN